MESGERLLKKRKIDDGMEGEQEVVRAEIGVEDDNGSADDSLAKKQKLTPPPKASENADSDADPHPEESLADPERAGEPVEAELNGPEATATPDEPGGPSTTAPKLSKNQLKKQRRHERWEAGREDRKVKRREKIKAKKERRREAFNNPDVPNPVIPPAFRSGKRGLDGVQVPITVIFDCDFESLMFDNEMKSLGLQITRSYSDNRKAPFRTHLAVSSFGGKMKERFDGILEKQYTSWQGCNFFSEDFVEVAGKAGEWMKGPRGGEIAGALKRDVEGDGAEEEEEGEIVYLSAESDNTLQCLKPNSTYIIGGLVDKNRHKGICYKRAMDRGIKTAKLPIGDFLQMNSRKVLVTNHVLEIMLKWIEYGDWGKAFMEVLPKRKGGALKTGLDGSTPGAEEEDDDDDEAGTEVMELDTTAAAGGEHNGEAAPVVEEQAGEKDAASALEAPE